MSTDRYWYREDTASSHSSLRAVRQTVRDRALGPGLSAVTKTTGSNTMVRHSLYSFGFTIHRGEPAFTITNASSKRFRPIRLLSNLKAPGIAAISGLAIDGEEQLAGEPVDLYFFSTHLMKKQNMEFLKEYGLQDKTDEEVDEWLDKRGMTSPLSSFGKLTLPTIQRNDRVSIQGLFLDGLQHGEPLLISLTGVAEER
jgi:hypothetical protein